MASRDSRLFKALLALVLVVNVAACGNDSQDPTSTAEACLNCAVAGSTGGGSNSTSTPNTTGGAKPAGSTTGGNTSVVTTNVAGMSTTGGSATNATGGTGSVSATGGSSTTTATTACKDQGSSCSLDSDCCQTYGPGTVSCQLGSCRMVAVMQTGGASSTGGSTSVVTTTGGKSSTGGSSATGSVTSTTGGTTVQATGGHASTGGASNATGGSSVASCLDQGSPCINDGQCCQTYGPGTVSCQSNSCRVVSPTQTGGASSTGGATSVGSTTSTGGTSSVTSTGGSSSVACVPTQPAFQKNLLGQTFSGVTSCVRDASFGTTFYHDGMTTNVFNEVVGKSLTDMYVASFEPSANSWVKHKTATGWEQVTPPMPSDYDVTVPYAATSIAQTGDLTVVGGSAMILNGASSTVFWLKQGTQNWAPERIPNIPDGSGQVKSIWTDGTIVAAIVRRDIVGDVAYESDDIYIRTADGVYTRQVLPSHTSLNLQKIDGRSAGELYVVGVGGMYHYDGCSWSMVTSLAAKMNVDSLVDIGINDREIFVADASGQVGFTQDLVNWSIFSSGIGSNSVLWTPGPGATIVVGNATTGTYTTEATVLSGWQLLKSATDLRALVDSTLLYITDLKKIQDKIVFVGYNGFDGVPEGYIFTCQ